MSGKSMDVFSLRDSIVSEYRWFATSFTTIHAEDIRAEVEAIYSEGRFWPDPLLQINPSYKRGANIETLISGGALGPLTAEIFRIDGAPLSLYKHQEQAIALASQGESYVVTTGTGSGESLCFFIRIVSAVVAEKRGRAARRTRAIIIYPMNALANSQFEELEKFVANVQGDHPVTFARYTGQEDSEKRRSIAEDPPDILLANFMMLELLMTQQDDLDRAPCHRSALGVSDDGKRSSRLERLGAGVFTRTGHVNGTTASSRKALPHEEVELMLERELSTARPCPRGGSYATKVIGWVEVSGADA